MLNPDSQVPERNPNNNNIAEPLGWIGEDSGEIDVQDANEDGTYDSDNDEENEEGEDGDDDYEDSDIQSSDSQESWSWGGDSTSSFDSSEVREFDGDPGGSMEIWAKHKIRLSRSFGLQPGQRQSLGEENKYSTKASSSFRLAKHKRKLEGGSFTGHDQCCDTICCVGSLVLEYSNSSLIATDAETGRIVCEEFFFECNFYSLSYDDHTGLVAVGGTIESDEHSLYLTALLGYDLADPHLHMRGQSHSSEDNSSSDMRFLGMKRMGQLPRLMVNSVRFGNIDGHRILAVSQNSHTVLVYTIVDRNGINLKCRDRLGLVERPGKNVCDIDHYPYKISLMPVFEIVCSAPPNIAVPSPNGRFLAIGGDFNYIALIDFKQGYVDKNDKTRPHIVFLEIPRSSFPTPYIRSQTGCQYLDWNADSNLLAATNDKYYGVTVWQVHESCSELKRRSREKKRSMVSYLVHFDTSESLASAAPSSISFSSSPSRNVYSHIDQQSLTIGAGSREDYLVWVQGHRSLFVACLGTQSTRRARQLRGSSSRQSPPFWVEQTYLRECMSADIRERRKKLPRRSFGLRQNRIYGLSTSMDGKYFLVSDFFGSYQFEFLRAWSKSSHKCFPRSFKEAIKCLVLVHGVSWMKWKRHIDNRFPAVPFASNESVKDAAPFSFALLPFDILYIICGLAAFPIYQWTSQDLALE